MDVSISPFDDLTAGDDHNIINDTGTDNGTDIPELAAGLSLVPTPSPPYRIFNSNGLTLTLFLTLKSWVMLLW